MLARYSYSLPPSTYLPGPFSTDTRLADLSLRLTEQEYFHLASNKYAAPRLRLLPFPRGFAILDFADELLIATDSLEEAVRHLAEAQPRPPAVRPMIHINL